MCGGRGGLLALRLAAKVLGPKTVYVNAAGCFALLATFPYTLSSTSGAIFRNLDLWYVCDDNESYGNTGVQMSSATPVAESRREGNEHGKEDLFEIWRAHRPPSIAIVSPRYPVDLTNKFLKARSIREPKLFLAHASCPPGWLFDPARTAEHARLAVEAGVFALKEAVDGMLRHTYVPGRRRRVEEYLRGQPRFAHLFEPHRDERAIERMRQQVDRYWSSTRDP